MSRWKSFCSWIGANTHAIRTIFPSPSWRWLQIRFSTILLLVLLFAVIFAWRSDRVRMEEEIIALKVQMTPTRKQTVAWGIEQLFGPPDTERYGDMRTAWASQTADGQPEWIVAYFEDEVAPQELHIYETFNPGAVNKVSIFTPLGNEVVVWQGTDPTKVGSGGGISKIPLHTVWSTKKVKIYLDSPAVAGWNEIDAVGLVDQKNQTQWTRFAETSSSYGAMPAGVIQCWSGMRIDTF